MKQGFSTDRRDFLKLLGLTGGGLVLGVPLIVNGESLYPDSRADAWQADAFIQVTDQGRVRLLMPQAEMGQGVSMGLATLVAEELNMSPAQIEVQVAGVHKAYAMKGIGTQLTGGSASIRERYLQLRQSAATVKHLLLQAAAQQTQVPVQDLRLRNGFVEWGTERVPVSELVATAAVLPVPEAVTLTQPDQFLWIGHDRTPRVDALAKVTGTAVFGIDVEIPDVKRAAIKRCPVIGGRLKDFNANGAEQLPGVFQVIGLDHGVAVLAQHFWQAKQAIQQIEVEWDLSMSKLANVSSASLEADLATALQQQEGDEAFKLGDGEKALASSATTLTAQYYAPYLAHATMEPMNCTVHLQPRQAEVWVGTQAPGIVQDIVAEISGINRDNIQVHTPYLGGGFGRRGFHDFVAEAATLAKAAGVPVQLVWTREDDTQNDYYRPAALVDLQAGLDEQGQLQCWSAKRAGANIMPYMMDEAMGVMMPGFMPRSLVNWFGKRGYGLFDGWVVDPTSVEGLHEDYSVPHKEVRHVTVDPGLRCGFWRSVGHSFSGFFVESFMDELAHAGGQDTLAFRLRHLQDNPRLKQALQQAANKAGWGKPKPGRFLGLAAVSSFESHVAEVAEVSVVGRQIQVHRVVCVVDCGRVINPDIVRTQMESSIIYGLSAALYGEITLEDGVVQQTNFHNYPVVTMRDAPVIDVYLIDSEAHPTGAGEPGLPPIAAAVGNAVFSATGQRLRRLPLTLEV